MEEIRVLRTRSNAWGFIWIWVETHDWRCLVEYPATSRFDPNWAWRLALAKLASPN